MRIGFDVDGVLADFVSAHSELIKEKTGVELPAQSDSFPDIWSYDKRALGEEKAREVFGEIANSFNFWMRLAPLPEGERILKQLSQIETSHQLYFITNRMGKTAKFQTEAWLLKWFQLPTVLIAADKAPIIKSLGLELYIDDRPETCSEVAEATDGKTLVLMPERPYNRNVIVDYRVTRVKNLERALGAMLWPQAPELGRLVA